MASVCWYTNDLAVAEEAKRDALALNRGTGVQTIHMTVPPLVDERAGTAIHIRDLAKQFASSGATISALESVDLDIQLGEFLCVVGPSGCGKTTLLNILGGLEPASHGTVDFAPQAPGRPLRSIIFQEQGVYPWLSVLDIAAFGLMARGVPKVERYRVAREWLRRIGLGSFEQAYPHQLSGGMRQRVNIARAFANDPEILLMDEPFAALDEQTKLILQDRLLQIWEGSRKTVLFITHSLDEAIRLADRVVVMTARPGRIKTIINVDLPRPRHVFALQGSADFARLRGLAWEALAEEVLAVQAREEEALSNA